MNELQQMLMFGGLTCGLALIMVFVGVAIICGRNSITIDGLFGFTIAGGGVIVFIVVGAVTLKALLYLLITH